MTTSPETTSERIAIIVPAYNAARTLAETIESAIAQDMPTEIVVVDDGSTDETLAIAKGFEPRVRAISGPNRGASAARNTGIAESQSEWIVFLDADDLLESGTLERRLACARLTAADVVITDWMEIIDDGSGRLTDGAHRTIDWSAMTADAEIAVAASVWATTAAILYRRSVVERIGGFRPDLPIIQDARFLFDAAHHGARFAHAKHVGARYRVLPGSLSRRNPARFSQDVLLNGKHIESLWAGKGMLDDAHKRAVLGIYNEAGRSLFRAAHPAYFEAVAAQRALGLPLPLHSRIAHPLAKAIGLKAARMLLSAVAPDR